MRVPAFVPGFVRIGVRMVQRLFSPTRNGGWPRIPWADHRIAVSVWRRFLFSGQYFGRTRLYQSYEPLALPGLRPSGERARLYGFDRLIGPGSRVLDIGCNMGCLTLEAANRAGEVIGIEVDEDLLWIAETLRGHAARQNVRFLRIPFGKFEDARGFDLVIASAVHKWVGMPFAEFIARVGALVRPGGALIFESNNYATLAAEFEDETAQLLRAGFSVIDSGQTNFDALRKFYSLRKQGVAPDDRAPDAQ